MSSLGGQDGKQDTSHSKGHSSRRIAQMRRTIMTKHETGHGFTQTGR